MDPLALLTEKKLPFAQLLGIRYTAAAPDRVVAEMPVREDLCNTPAVAHGGAIMAFAPLGAVLNGESTPVHRGRRTMVWQTRITTAEGKLVALVTQTQMVLT